MSAEVEPNKKRHGSEKRQRSYMIGVRVTPDEHAQIMAAAARTAYSRNEFVRIAALDLAALLSAP